MVADAKLNGIEPQAWPTDPLERMVSGRVEAMELERLLPRAWRTGGETVAWPAAGIAQVRWVLAAKCWVVHERPSTLSTGWLADVPLARFALVARTPQHGEPQMIRLRVNGLDREVEADPEMPLLWVLRDVLGLTGTKFGCGAGLCGACAVHVDGGVAWSCTVTLADSAGRAVTTIEGLHPRGDHPVQAAWLKHDVVQCGYCHPGMVMTVAGLLDGPDRPSLAELEAGIGNICRCGTYPRIRRALRDLVGA